MEKNCCANSGCTNHLGLLIDDTEDIAAFDAMMENVVITPEMIEMIDELIRLQRMGNL